MRFFGSFCDMFGSSCAVKSDVAVYNQIHPLMARVGEVYSDRDTEQDAKGNYLLVTLYKERFGGDAVPDIEECIKHIFSKFDVKVTKKDNGDYYGNRALTTEEAKVLSNELCQILRQ